jgi:hypothetical protein
MFSRLLGEPSTEAAARRSGPPFFCAHRAALFLFAVLADVTLAPASARAEPALEATQLYAQIARNCVAVDLSTFRHPTLDVLNKATIPVRKVELCNDKKYPIFTVGFRYDPDGPNDRYYNRLYSDIAHANAFWSYSLVDETFAMIANIAVDRKRQPSTTNISIDYERFAPPPAR